MENENAIIKLVDELVLITDSLASIRNENRILRDKLERLISEILDNSRLDYKEEDLDLKNDTPILQLVKFLDPVSYEERLGALKNKAQREKYKLENKPVKEARKDGK